MKLNPDDAVIVAVKRTPIGRALKGSLAQERPEDLSLTAVSAALASLPTLQPSELDDFYLGCAVPEGFQGDNIARRVAVLAGYDKLPATTVNRFCASSLQAAAMASQAIKAGDAQAILVGGVESVSTQRPVEVEPHPVFLDAADRADGAFETGADWIDPRATGEIPNVYISMGKTAEFVARTTGATRQDQDDWALESQMRATTALETNYFDAEIASHMTCDGTVVETDDGPRSTTTAAGLAGLNPAFHPEGTVTAGNASPLNDGASAMVIMRAARAQELGITPLARILGAAASALSPEIMGLGPVEATNTLLTRLGLTVNDIDIVELNEAFAAQVVPVVDQLGVDPSKVNPYGGAIALGHPFGATGVRLLGTLLNGLTVQDRSLGLATLCVGGGQGMAMVIERI
ncbi:MAG: acetyl-CoA C-acyltransferase [Micrococcaceae bacterium]|nr:acetyl-CoA C-acyltransferase [Micrococcaceae bacterium]